MTFADHSAQAAPRQTSLATALLAANIRYWPTVAPLVGRELRRWKRHAQAIPDGDLKELALDKLAGEHFNAQVAATLATLAPLRRRASVTRAIVAYQVLYDYLDGLTEQPVPGHLQSNLCLYRAFTDALADADADIDYYEHHPASGDGGYMRALSSTVRASLARLPGAAAMLPTAQASAQRCAEAQATVHASPADEPTSLVRWAEEQATDTPFGWREWLAGTVSCVLCVHALIAAAADPRSTRDHAFALDDAYLPIAALSTMLDGLVDWRSDRAGGETPWLLSRYEREGDLLQSLVDTAGCASARSRALPRAAHHLMTMHGVIAYYASSPAAAEPHAKPAIERLRLELGPTFAETVAVMRAWRVCKRVAASLRPTTRQATALG